MPRRPYKRRKRTRASAASTLQRAWRRKRAKKKPSVVVRQVLANKRNLKILKKDIEVKRADSIVATPDTNYAGHILQQTQIDSYGFAQSTALWNTSSSGGFLTQPSLYQTVALCPLWTTQGVDETLNRIGNDITMRSLTAKIVVFGGDGALNGGRWVNTPVLQKMRVYAILDKEPNPANSTLSTTPSAYQFVAQMGQMFNYNPVWNNTALPGLTVFQQPQLDAIFGILRSSANPPGLATNAVGVAQRFLVDQAYRNRDLIDKDRFRILAVKDFKVSQMANHPTTGTDRPFNCVKSHTMVLKQPFRFHYNSSKEVLPSNQRVYLLAVSDCATQRGSPATPVADYIDPPSIQMNCRFQYTDL